MSGSYLKLLTTLLILLIFSAPWLHAQEMQANTSTPAGESAAEQRIVVLYPLAFGIIFILDLAKNVVCLPMRSIGIADGKLESFYSTFAANLASVTDVGQPTSPNMETILKARPDLIVASKATEHANPAINVIRNNGVKILQLNAGFGTVSEWLEAVKMLASATGKLERARKYEDFYRQRLKLVQERIADIPVEKRPKVALLNTTGSQMVIRGSRTTFGYELISSAGGRLMEHGSDPADSAGCAELMFSFDPDIIIDDSKVDIFYKAEWWNSLRAVKENRVYKTPADDKQAWVTNWFLSTYSPIGILWLAKKIHPAKFSDIDLKAEHEAFCQMLYARPFKHSGTGFSE